MKPVLFSVGSYTVTTLGAFLVFSFLAGLFIIWRIIRRFEIDKEKTIDLFLLTSIISLLGARIYFLLQKPSDSLLADFFLVNKIPGFSFWGGLVFGLVTLNILAKRFKLNFWQAADFSMVALFLGISITSLGCLFNSCQSGVPSDLPIAVNQVGLIGKRFPLQILESLIFLIGFFYLWSQVIRFHFNGAVALKGFMILGIVKFILDFFRSDAVKVQGILNLGQVWSLGYFILGAVFYYRISKKSFWQDLKGIWLMFQDPNKRKLTVLLLNKSWYNFRINFKIKLMRFKKNMFKFLNIKSNPTNFP